jgi:hypothetical protein
MTYHLLGPWKIDHTGLRDSSKVLKTSLKDPSDAQPPRFGFWVDLVILWHTFTPLPSRTALMLKECKDIAQARRFAYSTAALVKIVD